MWEYLYENIRIIMEKMAHPLFHQILEAQKGDAVCSFSLVLSACLSAKNKGYAYPHDYGFFAKIQGAADENEVFRPLK